MIRILCLLLVSVNVFGATWYVRPASGEYGAEDGTSYATAYDGFLDIVWAADVDAGDTVYVCGTFDDNQQLLVQDSGSVGNVITIDGDCSASGDLAKAKIIAGTDAVALHNGDKVYITYKNLELVGGTGITQRVFDVTSASDTSATEINAVLQNITCHDTMGEGGTVRNSDFHCIRLDGSQISLTNITIYNTEGDGIYAEGNDHTLTNLTISNVDLSATPYGDCVQYGGGSSSTEYAHNRIVIDGLSCDHTSEATKHGVILGCDSGAGTSVGLVVRNSTIRGAQYNLAVDKCDEVLVERNLFVPQILSTNARGVATLASGTGVALTIRSNVFDMSNVLTGAAGVFIDTPTSGVFTVVNNSFAGNNGTISGIYFSSPTTSTHTISNNVVTRMDARGIRVDAGSTGPASYNAFDDNATDCQTITCTSSVSASPNFIGGINPTTPAGFRTKAGSALRAAGTTLGPMQDYGNRRFRDVPSIGAWEAASGDEATARTAATRAASTARTAATARTAR